MIKTFITKSVDYRSFELFDESETSLGKIVYPKWYSTNAEIHINPKIYKIESKGFWTTSLEVFEYEKAVMKFKMSWSGNIVLIDFTNGEKHFQINKEKWYNDVFEMKNEAEKTVLKIKRIFKWKDFKYYYEIEIDDENLLPITILGILHVVNYFNSSSDAAAYS